MKRGQWRHAAQLSVLGLVCANAVFAGSVKVTVKGKSGTPSADTIIVFDPLDATPPASHDTAIVDQVNKTFVPHVSVIRTGTAVAFPNSDRIRHQVYSFSPSHPFTLKLYAGSPRTDIVFDKPGMVVLGCNIHDSMVGVHRGGELALLCKDSRLRHRGHGPASRALPPARVELEHDHGRSNPGHHRGRCAPLPGGTSRPRPRARDGCRLA